MAGTQTTLPNNCPAPEYTTNNLKMIRNVMKSQVPSKLFPRNIYHFWWSVYMAFFSDMSVCLSLYV